MRHRGWLLDPYISEKQAIYWFKTTEGRAVRVEERHNPIIVAEPKPEYTIDNLVYLFEEHPYVLSATPVTRYKTIHRDQQTQYVEVKIDQAEDLEEIVKYAERLNEVKEVFNVGLIPIQWHLIYRGVQPSTLCEFHEINGKLEEIEKLDDSESTEPPPLKPLIFRTSERYSVDEVHT
ncbi:hypothetical protein E2P71_02125, partial [Candidatus Bathyarchaeota archaeon]